MKIIKPGVEVKTLIGEVKGMITEIIINFDLKPLYKIEYFFDGEFKHTWLSEGEFIADNKQYKTIGFKDYGK